MTDQQVFVPVNPVVKELLSKDVPGIVELSGYSGPSEHGRVRLYRHLNLRSYVDIPSDAVLKYVEPEHTEHSRCTIFFNNRASITYVTNLQTTASSSFAISATMNAAELERTALRGRSKTRPSSCSCASPRAAQAVPSADDDGPGLPPMGCEINCERIRNTCELFRPPSLQWWCLIDYWICLLLCDSTPDEGGLNEGGVVIT